MSHTAPMLLALLILSFLTAAIPCALFCYNLRLYTPPPDPAENLPAVSILIPARNEAEGIAEAIRTALLTANIPFELVLMDDASTDNTAQIIQSFTDPRVRYEQAPPLPPGWNGKQHACWALANAARNPILCFIDADVRLHPDCIARMATFLTQTNTQGQEQNRVPQVSHLRPGSQSPQSSSGSPQPGAPSFEPHPKGGVSFPQGNDPTPLRQPQTSNPPQTSGAPSFEPHPKGGVSFPAGNDRTPLRQPQTSNSPQPGAPSFEPHPKGGVSFPQGNDRTPLRQPQTSNSPQPGAPSFGPHPKGGVSFPAGNDPAPALVSGFPRQLTGSPLEWLLIPLIHFVLLGFLPLSRMRKTTNPAFAAGCGQFFLCDREAYFKTGGHSGIKLTMHDGLRLPRLFREHGYPTDLADLTPLASVRMYTNTRGTWQGLAKNATEGIAVPGRIVPISIILILGQVLPFVFLLLIPFKAIEWSQVDDDNVFLMGFVALIFSLPFLIAAWLPRILAARRFRQDWRSALLHPVGILVMLAVQWYSLARKLRGGQVTWRNRSYTKTSD